MSAELHSVFWLTLLKLRRVTMSSRLSGMLSICIHCGRQRPGRLYRCPESPAVETRYDKRTEQLGLECSISTSYRCSTSFSFEQQVLHWACSRIVSFILMIQRVAAALPDEMAPGGEWLKQIRSMRRWSWSVELEADEDSSASQSQINLVADHRKCRRGDDGSGES